MRARAASSCCSASSSRMMAAGHVSRSSSRRLSAAAQHRHVARSAASSRQPGQPRRSVAAAATAATAETGLEAVVLTFPVSPDPVAAVSKAIAAAEAAQQQLAAAGPLADAARTNQVLASVLETYSTVQQLYHKALRQLVQQHGALASSPAGLAYAILCEVLGQPPQLKPGDRISASQLAAMRAQWLTIMPAAAPILAPAGVVAGGIVSLLAALDLEPGTVVVSSVGDILVLPDLMTALALRGVAIAAKLSNIVRAALWLLPAADQAVLFQAECSINSWTAAMHSNPVKTKVGWVPVDNMVLQLLHACLFMVVSRRMQDSALRQLQGSSEPGNWVQPAAVLSDLQTNRVIWDVETCTFIVYEGHSLVLTGVPDNAHRIDEAHRVMDTFQISDSLDSCHMLHNMFATSVVVEACGVLTADACADTKKGAQDLLRQKCGHHLGFAFSVQAFGLDKLYDALRPCQAYGFYQQDIVELVLQQAGGPGPAAVAAAKQLYKERQSVFVARWALRHLAVLEQGRPALVHKTAVSTSAQQRALIMAGGDAALASTLKLQLQQGQPTPAPLSAPASPAGSGLGSSDGAVWRQLQGLLAAQTPAAAAAAANKLAQQLASSPGLEPAVVSALQECMARSIAFNKVKLDTKLPESVWFMQALLSQHIYEHASSPAMAQLLLGPGAVEEQFLAPVAAAMAALQASATAFADEVCSAGWSITGQAAAELTLQHIPAFGTPGISKLRAHMWLAAAHVASSPASHASASIVSGLLCAGLFTESQLLKHNDLTWSSLNGVQLIVALLYIISPAGSTSVKAVHIRTACSLMQQLLVDNGSSFSQLEPVLQAVLQASMKTAVTWAVQQGAVTYEPLVALVKAVPLLHAQDYERLLEAAAASGSPELLSTVWTAAVGAATDAQLAATPAFGGQRPTEAWLVQLMPKAVDVAVLEGVLALLAERPQLGSGVRLAALAAAANRGSNVQVLQLWSTVAAGGDEPLTPAAASAVAARMQRDASLAGQLLEACLLAPVLAASLLQAAVSGRHASVVEQLLVHAEQQQLLQQLPSALLASALQLRPAMGASSSSSATLQLFAVLLQQGQAPDTAVAAVVEDAASSNEAWQELLVWLQEQCATAPAAAAHAFLCCVLQSAARAAAPDQTWGVWQLLASRQEHQAVPAPVLSVLVVQQAGAHDRVVELWQHFSSSSIKGTAAASLLEPAAAAAVMTALVSQQQHLEAVQLLKHVPSLLRQLAQQWARQQLQGVEPSVLAAFFELAVQAGTADAAAAVELTLQCLATQQGLQSAVAHMPALGLVQLLCKHSALEAACSLTAAAAAMDAPGSAQAAAAEAAKAGASLATYKQLLLAGLDPAVADGLMRGALSAVLASAPAAAGGSAAAAEAAALQLIAWLPRDDGAPLPTVLDDQQLQGVARLVCASRCRPGSVAARVPGGVSFDSFVSDFLAAPGSPEVAVMLLNASVEGRADLAPAAAAVSLGLVSAADLLTASSSRGRLAKEGSSTAAAAGSSSDANAAALRADLQRLVLLCESQLPQRSDAAAEELDDVASRVSWAAALTPEAAAAALFGLWCSPRSTAAALFVGELALELYLAARPKQAKHRVDSLLLDLGLAAAARGAAAWSAAAAAAAKAGNSNAAGVCADGAASCYKRGLDIIHTAEVAVQASGSAGEGGGGGASGGSKRRDSAGSSMAAGAAWVPLLPEAQAALVVTVAHAEGVDKAAEVLLAAFEQQVQPAGQQQQVAGGAAASRKGKAAAPAASQAPAAAAPGGRSLLSLPVVGAFLAAALDVAAAAQQLHAPAWGDGADEAAAALSVASQLFAHQLAGGDAAKLAPDGAAYAAIVQLCGLAGQHTQLADWVLAAARQCASGPGGGGCNGLQHALAAAAAVYNAAKQPGSAPALVDALSAAGVPAVTDPGLALELVDAALTDDRVCEALARRLQGSSADDVVDQLLALGESENAAAGTAVLLVQPDNKAPDAPVLRRVHATLVKVASAMQVAA